MMTKCLNCNRVIEKEPGRKQKKYCNASCRQQFYNANYDRSKSPGIGSDGCAPLREP
jgi:hypothetical protein